MHRPITKIFKIKDSLCLAFFLVVLVTCSQLAVAQMCTSNANCVDPTPCVNGFCEQCRLNSDCSVGEICDIPTTTCIADPVGSGPCDDGLDCNPGEFCSAQGQCLSVCSSDFDCPGSQLCSLISGSCYSPECTSGRDCALGECCAGETSSSGESICPGGSLAGFCLIDLRADRDKDGIPDGSASEARDNCPADPNTDQEDLDSDGLGDVCDLDDDGDGTPDTSDNCPRIENSDQADRNSDGTGDACSPDRDHDGVPDEIDNCGGSPPGSLVANPDQVDTDRDGLGNACDLDDDNDSIVDTQDACPLVYNINTTDADNNGVPDTCQDIDEDGVPDTQDNCFYTSLPGPNPNNAILIRGLDGQSTGTSNLSSHQCFTSADGERYCYNASNPGQLDFDEDGIGNLCDSDIDGDNVNNDIDNCVYVFNPDQSRTGASGRGNACLKDIDQDGTPNDIDDCPLTPNTQGVDPDNDGIGAACDLCPAYRSGNNFDTDSDGRGDVCDSDIDNDGWLNNDDNCPGMANADQLDANADGIGDICQ